MAQDRKAPEKALAPIPKPKKDDAEDVSWALSTAEATWGRGDRADALKWIRRAAEAASEAEHDDRALELAKAAADLAPLIGRPSGPPPLPGPTSSRPPAKPSSPPKVGQAQTRPSQAPPRPNQATLRASQAPPRLSNPGRPSGVSSVAQPTPSSKGPTALRAAAISLTGQRAFAKAPLSPAMKALPETRTPSERPPAKRPSGTNETRRRRSSKPPPSEVAGEAPEVFIAGEAAMDDVDAWPTQTLPGRHAPPNELVTQVGVPAYRDREAIAPESGTDGSKGPKASQAMRVVVWRSPEGVHVAPYGATVRAPTVDAMLVALDPSADLTAWLSDK